MYIFLVFWSLLDEKNAPAKASFRAYFMSASVVLVMNMINLVVLGPQYAKISTVPLLQSVQLIQIAEVFERFDAVIILLFYVGILIKATLWSMAAAVGLGELFHTSYRRFIIPVGAVIYAAAFIPQNFQQHLAIGRIIARVYRINQIFILVIPLMLYIAMLLRRRKNGLRELPADHMAGKPVR
jgi:spore germination protein KB